MNRRSMLIGVFVSLMLVLLDVCVRAIFEAAAAQACGFNGDATQHAIVGGQG